MVSDKYVKPDGTISVTVTSIAVSGPLLVTFKVNLTVSPVFGVGLFTVLASSMSTVVSLQWLKLLPATMLNDVSPGCSQ